VTKKVQIVTVGTSAEDAIGNTLVNVIPRLGWNLTSVVIKMNVLAIFQIMNVIVHIQIGRRVEVITRSVLKQPLRPHVVNFIPIIV
jgi:hypothetical protein